MQRYQLPCEELNRPFRNDVAIRSQMDTLKVHSYQQLAPVQLQHPADSICSPMNCHVAASTMKASSTVASCAASGYALCSAHSASVRCFDDPSPMERFESTRSARTCGDVHCDADDFYDLLDVASSLS